MTAAIATSWVTANSFTFFARSGSILAAIWMDGACRLLPCFSMWIPILVSSFGRGCDHYLAIFLMMAFIPGLVQGESFARIRAESPVGANRGPSGALRSARCLAG